MRPRVDIAAFSDIHHHEYSTGVTLADTIQVERRFNELARERNVDFCIFAGDRYLSHTPDDWIRLEADRVQRERNDMGLVTFSLIGNHDVWAKAPISGHSNRQVQQLWQDVHPNLVVMDEPRTYQHQRLLHVRVHALPAGFPMDLARYQIDPTAWNILVFHCMVEGCIIDPQTGYRSPKGALLQAFDQPCFDLVLAGDVHTPQKLDFKQTRGGYIGAAIQQNRRDRGDPRGYLFSTLEDSALFPASLGTEFVPSPCPHFLELAWDFEVVDRLPTADEARDYLLDCWGETGVGALVDVVLTGRRDQVEQATPAWREDLRVALGARQVKPPIKTLRGLPLVASSSLLTGDVGSSSDPVESRLLTAQEQLRRYLVSGRAVLEGLDAVQLLARSHRVLEAAKGSER